MYEELDAFAYRLWALRKLDSAQLVALAAAHPPGHLMKIMAAYELSIRSEMPVRMGWRATVVRVVRRATRVLTRRTRASAF